jgi:hypothetical protein
VSSAPAAQAKSSKWEAASTTALAITGNIRVSADRITFANGAHIGLAPVGADHPNVFAVKPSANPTLLNGNKLCGTKPPTYVVIARDGNSLYFKVSDGQDMPEGRADPLPEPGICATYNYVR